VVPRRDYPVTFYEDVKVGEEIYCKDNKKKD
jgi:hypothetical protein